MIRPIIDGEEIPDEPYDLYQNGNITNAEIMIDYTLNEAQTFMTVNITTFLITRVRELDGEQELGRTVKTRTINLRSSYESLVRRPIPC